MLLYGNAPGLGQLAQTAGAKNCKSLARCSMANVYDEELALFEKLIATQPAVERKGATMPYTSMNGHMFSFFTKEGALALRLPTDAREAFLQKHKTELCVQYGTVMKEYVVVPASLLRKTATLKKYFAQSCEYIAGLKPKPTKRKKKVAKKKVAKKKVAKKKVR